MDILEYIKQMQEMYGEDVITTADKINRPEPKREVQEIELFNEFNKRNPKADGGMLNAMQIGENRGDRIGFRKPRKPNSVESFSPEIQERIKNFGIKKYNKLTTTQKYEVRNPRTSTTPYTFNFGKKKFDLTVKGLTKSGANNLQELLNLINEKDLTPNKWFGKTSKARKAKGGLDLLARDLVKYLQGFEISDTRGNKINQRIFDELDIKKLIGKDKIDILSQIDGKSFRQTIAKKASAKSKVEASFDAVKFINKEFMLDPDATLEELAEQIYGKGASNSVRALKDTQADVAKYLDVLKTGTRRGVKIPDFKYPSAKKVFEILDSIEDRSSTFGFDEGILRDLKFNIRDNLLNFKKGSTTSLRRMLSEVIAESNFANNVIDEAVGLSATYDKLPGYTEATQILSKELNQRKAFEIDKPFNQIINKVYDGKATSKEIKAYNAIARKFIKETKINVPIIKSTVTGDDIKNPKKYIRNFNSFSPEAQKNILKIAKDKKFVIQTGAKPLALQKGKATMETAKNFLKDLEDLCPNKKASGGRIGYQDAGAVTGTLECGLNQFNKNLKTGNANSSLMRRILANGGNILKSAGKQLNPAELLRLRNLIGPQALGFFAAYEAGDITDDILRKNIPVNEALAKNWLTKTFLPYREQGARAKNLLQSGKLTTDAQKKYALDLMKLDQAIIKQEQVEQMKLDQGLGYGKDESGITNEMIDAAEKDLERRVSAIGDPVFTEGSAIGQEYQTLEDEMIASRLDKFKLPFQSDRGTRLVNKLAKPPGKRIGPMTAKKEMKVDFSLPTYDRSFPSSNKFLNQYLESIGKTPLQPGEGTLFRMNQPNQRGLYGTQEKFASGGLANLTDTIPPESGPMSQGLRSLYNNGKKL